MDGVRNIYWTQGKNFDKSRYNMKNSQTYEKDRIDTVLKNAAAIARDLIRADANKGPV